MMETENLQLSKEYQLAMSVESALNNYSFSNKRFAGAIRDMHPTLQQKLYTLIRECLKEMADDNRYYDDRNRASHLEAQGIMEYLSVNGRAIPCI
jgi:hypothetical protein